MKLPVVRKILRAMLVGAVVAVPFVVAIVTLPSLDSNFNRSPIALFIKATLLPQNAEAIMQRPCELNIETGQCDLDGVCAGVTSQCTSDAECGAGESCAYGRGDCRENICVCTPQCDGKTCGGDGCGGFCGTSGGSCANGFTCTAGNCAPAPAYCPRTDNPIRIQAFSFTPSASGAGDMSLKITSNGTYCPIGSVSQTPCSTHSGSQATCVSEGCAYTAPLPGQCTPKADQVDCSAFNTAQTCRNITNTKGQCAWVSDGSTGPLTPQAAAGLAAQMGDSFSCQTKASFCSSTIKGTCEADQGCMWLDPQPAACYGTPSFKTSAVVNIGEFASKIYERKIYQVPVWDYRSCSFWRCTTKTGYDPHNIEGSCVVGGGCGWADRCVIRACTLLSSAEVSATYDPRGKGWRLESFSRAGTYDPTLLNNCWGSNPNGRFIPEPGCCVTGETCPVAGACGGTNNACSAGYLSDAPDSDSQYLWYCQGTNGGTIASCALPKPSVNGSCNNATINGCFAGTLSDIADSSSQYLWNCLGKNGGTNQSCAKNIPVNGQCNNASRYSCASGAYANGRDLGDRYTWDCLGLYGGSNASPACIQMKPEAGVCSSVHYGCNTPTASPAASQSDNLTNWKWTCPGRFGGSNTACQENKIQVNGACRPNHYACQTGNAVNNYYDGLYYYAWNCNGANGGSNANCSEDVTPPPVDGRCDYAPGNTYQCITGSSIGGYDAGDAWLWNCAGKFGGRTVSCTTFKPVAGVCSAAHYSCDKGTSVANVDGASRWTWTCNGLYGGLAQNCSENKPVVITWNPSATPTIDYHTKVSYSYSTANAVSCDYYEVKPDNSLVRIGGDLASTWTGPQGEYDADVVRRLTCRNASGKETSSDYRITVRQNGAKCISVVPESNFLTPGQSFNVTARMENTGDNGWTTGAANYVLSRNDSLWGLNTIRLTNPKVNKGSQGIFATPPRLTAPLQNGDYDFTWQMRPVFGGVWYPVFGDPCGVQNANNDKLHVQPATLALTPQSYQFADAVIGDDPSTLKVHFKNLGGGTITGIRLNDIAAPFSCIPNCNLVLGPGAEGDITLAFTPVATGTRSQDAPITNSNSSPTVPIIDEVSKLPVDHIYIYGKGTDKFTISSDDGGVNMLSSIDFGDVPWTTTKYMTVTIQNRSKTKSGTIDPSVDLPSQFSCESGCGARTLNPGEKQTVRLKFYPDQKVDRLYEGVFNVGATPDVHLNIRGRGVLPEFQTQER